MKIIDYIILIILATCIGIIFWYKHEVSSLKYDLDMKQAQLDHVIDVNKTQQATIETLQADAIQNGKIVADLTKQVDDLNNDATTEHSNVNDLERNEDEVRKYLDTPVPAALRKLLNHT